ncbi:MAG TPA: mechanosensitive ion channel domain-containing protein [Gammaproteobacteria bacterium]|nr:mechanosensitive ion channel domain-containing protein [Gammaproteobacteria bacterium]
MTMELLHNLLPAVAALLAFLACFIGFALARRLTTHMHNGVLPAALRRLREPALLAAPVLAASAALPFAHLPAIEDNLLHLHAILLIVAVAWASMRAFDIWRDVLLQRYRLDAKDNLQARRVHTQIQVLRRIAVGVIVIVGIAAILMTFPAVRAIGATLFASAGVAGLVLGLAARPAISNLLAGLQIALSEPIRIDDVVIVESEWGRIEEIRTTYVVVRIWDKRRLIVPLSYFIEKPFQNWTRQTSELLGTVFIYADYTLPVAAVREELQHIVESTPLWDHQACGLVVTDATEHSVQLRALMSAANSSDLWDLRCLVREQLIEFLQRHYPQCLPRSRVDLNEMPAQPISPK